MSSDGATAAGPDPEPALHDLLAVCESVLGRQLTAYLAGARSVAELGHWIDGQADASRRRLLVAEGVINTFAARNRAAGAAPWLRKATAGGQSPARAIRELGDDDFVGKSVVESAAVFAAR